MTIADGIGTEDDYLQRLALDVGILPQYFDLSGTVRRTSDETRHAILAAMGFDVSTAHRRRALVEERERLAHEQPMPPVRVVEEGLRAPHIHLPSHRLPIDGAHGRWRVTLREEDGETTSAEGRLSVAGELLEFHAPKAAKRGYHQLELLISTGGGELRFEQTLIVVPSRCYTPTLAIGDDRVFGVLANLYTLRSHRNWGIGDLADLGDLQRWAASVGAEFVGINPLHALLNRGHSIAPYSPLSRLFGNPLYIAIDDVPERRRAPTLEARLESVEMHAMLRDLREVPNVDYDRVMAVKGLALDALYGVFASEHDPSRMTAFDGFSAAREPELTRFATWMALWEVHGAPSPYGNHRPSGDWRDWPEELRRPDTPAVSAFQEQHAERIAYHRWLQFELDRQLGQASAQGIGMRIGLYQDLAVGSAPDGADTWAHPELFVHGVSIGAPPDPYSATGQEWGLPPINPDVLARDRYRYFTEVVRANLRHAGALRIDHVMGLFRQFWIPRGGTAADGAYVRYPADDLLGIIALESIRHRALIVGEDLGTVPPEVPEALTKWGMLSSRVMYFSKDPEHPREFAAAGAYPPSALSTANTHDLPPINGFWKGRDIEIRRQVGALSDGEAEERRGDRELEKLALVRRLYRSNVLPENAAPDSMAELRGAVHAFLCGLKSQLVGLSLDDLTGETDPVNVPGVRVERYPCWTRKMHGSVADLASSPEVQTALRCDERVAKRE